MTMVMSEQIGLTKYLHQAHFHATGDNTIVENVNPDLLQDNSTEADTGLADLIPSHTLIIIGATVITASEEVTPNPITDNLIEVLHKIITPHHCSTYPQHNHIRQRLRRNSHFSTDSTGIPNMSLLDNISPCFSETPGTPLEILYNTTS